MSSKGISLRKISRMSGEVFRNALRLHYDSILLYRCQSFASAYFMSVLALEELGKVTLLEDFVWHSKIDGRGGIAEEEQYISSMFKHQHKQARFARHSEEILPKKILEDMRSGRVELLKQNAVYVGLERKKGKINLKSRIITPFKIQREKAKEQVTIVHDYLLVITLGVMKEVYSVDTEDVEVLLDKSLLSWLRQVWRFRSLRAKRIIQQLERVK